MYESEYKINNDKITAMLLAYNGILPPKEWCHDPSITDINKCTVAMILIRNGIIPPKEWIHDPNIKDKYNHTVAYYFKLNKIPVPNEWYDEDMKDIEKKPEFV